MDLSTRYLGLDLAHPFMPGASPLVDHIDMVLRLEDAGASAIVLNSLFEEDIERHGVAPERYLVQFLEWGQSPAHAVDAVNRDDGHTIGFGGAQHPFKVTGIAVREGQNLHAVGLGDAGSFLDRVMGVLVHDQEILSTH